MKHVFASAGLLLLLTFNAVGDECMTVETSINGESMEGLLWQGQSILVHGLGCGEPKRYDYIVFHVEDSKPQVIKQLWGMPGDILSVLDNGRFEINGVLAKTPFGKPYVLLGSARSRMRKVAGTIDGYLLLGHPGSVDSAKIGLVRRSDILGYVPNIKTD